MIANKYIYITERDGKVAVWVSCFKGNGNDPVAKNIWDIPKEQATPEVLTAIESAVQIGIELGLNRASKILWETSYNNVIIKKG